MNENIKLFIEANKDKVRIKTNDSGGIVLIESLVSEEELKQNDTNCKIEKDGLNYTLSTKDGFKIELSFMPYELTKLKHLGKKARKLKMKSNLKPKQIAGNVVNFIKSIPGKIIHKKDESEGVIEHKPSPLGNINSIQNDANKLIEKLDAIFEKYSENPKYNTDEEIQKLKERYNELKIRYANGLRMNDTQEVLNVKVKLVSLSGRVIARERAIDSGLVHEEKKEEPGKSPEEKTNPTEITPTPSKSDESISSKEPSIVTNPTESIPSKEPSIVTNPTESTPVNTGEVKNVKTPSILTPSPIIEEPVVEKRPERSLESIEIARDEERKQQIKNDIENSNKKISNIEENIKYFESRIAQTEELIKTSNLDSMEIRSYNKVKENYQEKLNNQKVLLEQAKEELKQNVSKLAAFMAEEVTYYVDGKPYKKVTRAELEKYKQQHISDEKRKEDFARQKELLEERKELERKLKENYEALKSLSTFEDEMLLPKEEPSIEEIQETVRRFHQ